MLNVEICPLMWQCNFFQFKDKVFKLERKYSDSKTDRHFVGLCQIKRCVILFLASANPWSLNASVIKAPDKVDPRSWWERQFCFFFFKNKFQFI